MSGSVAGVDGCRGGWVAAVVPIAGTGATAVVVRSSLAGLLDALGPVAVTGIDMPLRLPVAGRRTCEDEARARLGPRRSSIFPAPLRCTLGARTHAEAVGRARAAGGPAPSIQAYHLLPKIEEAMAVPGRLHEVSPELSFAALAGAPLATRKRTAEGIAERVTLLAPHVCDLAARLASPHAGAARDDVLDAYAAAWTARRIAAGTATRFGDRDDDAIWM